MLAAAATFWVTAALAQRPAPDRANTSGQWVCVPGEAGTWRCGRGGEVPEAAPLPELKPPNTPGAEVFGLMAPPMMQPKPLNAAEMLVPDPGPADAPDRYTLVIASVSGRDEIPGFVDSYGLDPSLVRFMPVHDGEVTRQVILWGSFPSPAAAARAMAAMPSAVRAMRPQIGEVASMDETPRPYASLSASETEAATPLAADPVQTRQPAVPVATDVETPILAVADPVDPGPANEDPTNQELADLESIDSDPPTRIEAPSRLAIEPGATPPATTTSPRQPQRPVSVTKPAPAAEVAAAEASAKSTETPTRRPSGLVSSAEPEPGRPTARLDRTSTIPKTDSAPVNRRPAEAAARQRPSGWQPDPVPAMRTRGTSQFAALDSARYTIQVANLRTASQVDAWLARHGLSANSLFALEVDEGAGPRTLLLYGDFASPSAAEEQIRLLPKSIRLPWVRSVRPLQKLTGNPP